MRGLSLEDKTGELLDAVGITGDANESTICARLPAFTPRNSAPRAIFSTIRI
jgi:hypothetical protein